MSLALWFLNAYSLHTFFFFYFKLNHSWSVILILLILLVLFIFFFFSNGFSVFQWPPCTKSTLDESINFLENRTIIFLILNCMHLNGDSIVSLFGYLRVLYSLFLVFRNLSPSLLMTSSMSSVSRLKTIEVTDNGRKRFSKRDKNLLGICDHACDLFSN